MKCDRCGIDRPLATKPGHSQEQCIEALKAELANVSGCFDAELDVRMAGAEAHVAKLAAALQDANANLHELCREDEGVGKCSIKTRILAALSSDAAKSAAQWTALRRERDELRAWAAGKECENAHRVCQLYGACSRAMSCDNRGSSRFHSCGRCIPCRARAGDAR